MSVTGLLFLCLFGYSLAIPREELSIYDLISDPREEGRYPKVLEDHLGLNNLVVQWNKEGKIYLINGNNTSTHFDAQRICQKYNMELIKIENEVQSRILSSLLEKYTTEGDGPFWMAGNRIRDGVSWRWMDDQFVTYFNWFPGEPNNAKTDEMCIELYGSGAWNDERCTIENGFVCENIPMADSGFVPILDSNDILDDEDKDVIIPSRRVIPDAIVSNTDEPSYESDDSEIMHQPTVMAASSVRHSTEEYATMIDLTEEVGVTPAHVVGYDYESSEEIEEDEMNTNQENNTSTTEPQPNLKIRPNNFHPSFTLFRGFPRYIPPTDDSEEYGDYSETDREYASPDTFEKEGYKSVATAVEPEVIDESVSDKESKPRIANDYGREYFGKEW